MHPSCIKIPGSKDPNLQYPLSSNRDSTDVREQICSRNDLINMANETFGTDKWNHVITNQTLDFVEYITGKYYVGCAAFVKVQLADGCFHEDLGYSNSEGHSKGLAIFSARTGSITNALKNTLLCFGGEIATKIKNFIQSKTDASSSVISAIGEPQRIVIPKPRIAPPQAQSTPEKQKPSALTFALGNIENDNQANSSGNNNERKIQSPQCSKPVENGARIDKAALTDEERRLERKRRQAQKQEEYKKLLKEKESAERANARF